MKKTIYVFVLTLLMAIAIVVTGCTTTVDQGPVEEEDIPAEEAKKEWPEEKESM